jgi:hypothetical protein
VLFFATLKRECSLSLPSYRRQHLRDCHDGRDLAHGRYDDSSVVMIFRTLQLLCVAVLVIAGPLKFQQSGFKLEANGFRWERGSLLRGLRD